jgi:hypothetical protein
MMLTMTGKVRFLRLRTAPQFSGMDKNRFTVDVRPYLTEIPIGVQGIAFDCVVPEAFADYYKSIRGRRAFELCGLQSSWEIQVLEKDEQSRLARGTEQSGTSAGSGARSSPHVRSSTSRCGG